MAMDYESGMEAPLSVMAKQYLPEVLKKDEIWVKRLAEFEEEGACEHPHLKDGLEMAGIFRKSQEGVAAFLSEIGEEGEESEALAQEVAEMLPFMALTGDIGKSGGLSERKSFRRLVLSLYGRSLGREDMRWLTKYRQTKLPGAGPELKAALVQMGHPAYAPEGPRSELYETVFKRGAFASGPILVTHYLFYRRQLEEGGVVQVDPEDWKLLEEKGLDPASTKMADFWSKAHIQLGDEMASELPEELMVWGKLALSHHFSQGIVPEGFKDLDFADKKMMFGAIALLEVMDKVNAFRNRSNENLEGAFGKTMKKIELNLAVLPGVEEGIDLREVYGQASEFLKKAMGLAPTVPLQEE